MEMILGTCVSRTQKKFKSENYGFSDEQKLKTKNLSFPEDEINTNLQQC